MTDNDALGEKSRLFPNNYFNQSWLGLTVSCSGHWVPSSRKSADKARALFQKSIDITLSEMNLRFYVPGEDVFRYSTDDHLLLCV